MEGYHLGLGENTSGNAETPDSEATAPETTQEVYACPRMVGLGQQLSC